MLRNLADTTQGRPFQPGQRARRGLAVLVKLKMSLECFCLFVSTCHETTIWWIGTRDSYVVLVVGVIERKFGFFNFAF